MSIFAMSCSKCGVSLCRQALVALAIDFGAQTVDPNACLKGGEHVWVEPDAERLNKAEAGRG